MSILGNLIWLLCGGFISAISWFAAGILWCCTVVGIPIGLQCFKFAGFALMPFGREIHYGGGAGSFIMNICWMIFSGFLLAIEHLTIGILLCITVIGIPFGLQQFKFAKLALMPFGSEVY